MDSVNVHHKYPYHFVVELGRPDLELDERNLFTMCVECDAEHHILIGHLDSFLSFNPNLEYFIALCRGLLASQIRSTKQWQDAVLARPKPLHLFSPLDKKALRQELDLRMPIITKG